MAVVVNRNGTTVTALVVGDEKFTRSETCRNIQCAVMLETKLTTDAAFADRWVRDKEAALPVSIPSKDERKPAIRW